MDDKLVDVLINLDDLDDLECGWRSPFSIWGTLSYKCFQENTSKTRKRLYTIWHKNCSKIRNIVKRKRYHLCKTSGIQSLDQNNHVDFLVKALSQESAESTNTDLNIPKTFQQQADSFPNYSSEKNEKTSTENANTNLETKNPSNNQEDVVCDLELSETYLHSLKHEVNGEGLSICENNKSDLFSTAEGKLTDVSCTVNETDSKSDVNQHFSFQLTEQEWENVKPYPCSRNRKLTNSWTRIFANHITKEIETCPLVFTYNRVKVIDSRKTKSVFFRGKARCKFPGCKSLDLRIRKTPTHRKRIKVRVNVSGTLNHQDDPQGRFCKGEDREKIEKEAREFGASETYHRRLGTLSELSYQSRNYTDCPTPGAIRKVLSQSNMRNRLDENMMLECHFLHDVYKEEDIESRYIKGYLQYVCVAPLTLIMYMEEQIKVAKDYIKQGLTLYLDATGTVVGKIPKQKRVLYYPLLIKSKQNEPPLPIAEMVTTEHTTVNIQNFLLRFLRHNFEVNGSNTNPKRVEIDFSWALLHATCHAFNTINIDEYIKKLWVRCTSPTFADNIVCILHICSAHFLHNCAIRLLNLETDKNIREFLMFSIARLLNANDLNNATNMFRMMCLVFGSEYETQDVTSALSKLTKIINLQDEETTFELESSSLVALSTDTEYKDSGRQKSPFYRHFNNIYQDIVTREIKTCKATNKFHSKEGMLFVLKEMHIFPLWSGLFLETKTRETNSIAEKWMSIVKNDILQKKQRLRPAEFIRRMHVSLKGRLRRYLMTQSLEQEKSSKKSDQVSALEIEETWNKTPKRESKTKTKYFAKPQKLEEPKPSSTKSRTPKKTLKTSCTSTSQTSKQQKVQELSRFSNKSQTPANTVQRSPTFKSRKRKNFIFDEMTDDDDIHMQNQTCSKQKTKENQKLKSDNNEPIKFTFRSFNAPKWGGRVQVNNMSIKMANTCPVDNLLFILHVILNFRKDLKKSLSEIDFPAVNIILDCMDAFKTNDWFWGKFLWLKYMCGFQTSDLTWNVWGSEDERVLQFIDFVQETKWVSQCSKEQCPRKVKEKKDRKLILNPKPFSPISSTSLQDIINAWQEPVISCCDVQCTEDTGLYTVTNIFDENGIKIAEERKNLCDGIRTESQKSFVNGYPPFIIMDVSSITGHLHKTGLPKDVRVLNEGYMIIAVTSMCDNHITSYVKDVSTDNDWYHYDGLKTQRVRKARVLNLKNVNNLVCFRGCII